MPDCSVSLSPSVAIFEMLVEVKGDWKKLGNEDRGVEPTRSQALLMIPGQNYSGDVQQKSAWGGQSRGGVSASECLKDLITTQACGIVGKALNML